jgi:hypothetical protein
MDEQFTETLVARIRAARVGVRTAVSAHDPRAVSHAVDELEDALRAAREYGVEIPPASADDPAEPGRG